MHEILILIATKSAEEMINQLEFLGNYLKTEYKKINEIKIILIIDN